MIIFFYWLNNNIKPIKNPLELANLLNIASFSKSSTTSYRRSERKYHKDCNITIEKYEITYVYQRN